MEQNRRPKHECTQLEPLDIWQECQKYTLGKEHLPQMIQRKWISRYRQIKRLLYSQGNSQLSEEKGHRVGKKLYHLYIWYRTDFQNMQRTQKTKNQENIRPNSNLGDRYEPIISFLFVSSARVESKEHTWHIAANYSCLYNAFNHQAPACPLSASSPLDFSPDVTHNWRVRRTFHILVRALVHY